METRAYSLQEEVHQHAFHQIVLPKTGSMEMQAQGVGGRVDGTRGAFIRCGATHVFKANSNSQFVVLDIGVDAMERLPSGEAIIDRADKNVFFPITPQLRHLIDYVSTAPPTSFSVRLAEAWAALMVEGLAQRTNGSKSRSTAFGKAVGYVEARLGEKVTARETAKQAGMSERALYTAFKDEFGTTPQAYLMARRAERALELLAGSSMSLTEIALLTGHADQSVLTKHLRKRLGITPGAYRKALKGPPF